MPRGRVTRGRAISENGFEMVANNPLLGLGFDAFVVGFTHFATRNGIFRVEQAHNDYLQMLTDGGIFAFLLVALFIFYVSKEPEGDRRFERQTPSESGYRSIGGLSGDHDPQLFRLSAADALEYLFLSDACRDSYR